jgi:hypothetical protein
VVECFEKSPLSLSKGISHYLCENGQVGQFYPNWSPMTFLGLAQLRTFLDVQEPWLTRVYFIFFSLLNTGLVFLIAQNLFKGRRDFAFLVTTLHTGTVFTIMYASHPDFVSTFSTFFMNLALYAVVSKRSEWICGLLGLVAGLVCWIGFFFFPAWSVYRYLTDKKVLNRVNLFWMPVAVLVGLALMMWLHQTADIIEFLKFKLLDPKYVQEYEGITYVLKWIYTFVQTEARFLHPVIAALMIFGLYVIVKKDIFESEFYKKLIFISIPGLLFMGLGHEFVYNHSFQYHPIMATFAILAAVGLYQVYRSSLPRKEFLFLAWTLFIFTAFYPYGKYKSIVWLDAINSLLIISTCFMFIFALKNNQVARYTALLILVFVTNLSQYLNYRNEKPVDWQFCEDARKQYQLTGQPVLSPIPANASRKYHCRGIPIQYPEASE